MTDDLREKIARVDFVEIWDQNLPPFDFSVDESEQGDARFAAWIVSFPNCIAQGPSLKTALERLKAIFPEHIRQASLPPDDWQP